MRVDRSSISYSRIFNWSKSMKPIRTIRPDIDENFLIPIIISEAEKRYLIVGVASVLGFILALFAFTIFLIMS